MELTDLAQWIGTVGIVAFYPIQNWRLLFTRNPVGLSFLAFALIAVGISGYLALGMHLGLVGLFRSNTSNLAFATLILLIVWFRSQGLRATERAAGLLTLIVGFGALIVIHLAASPIFASTAAGWLGLSGVVAFYPIQNANLFRTKDPTGLSLLAFACLTVGLAFYALLGFLVKDITIIIGNGVTFLGSLVVIYMIIRYRKK